MLRVLSLSMVCVVAGCSSEPEGFGVGEAREAIAGTYTGTWSAEGKTGAIELRLDLTAAAEPKCGSRTLSLKCVESTSVRLVGTVTTSDGALTTEPVSGYLHSSNNSDPSRGYLSIWTSAGRTTITASFAKATLSTGRVALDGGRTLAFTAERTAP